MKKKIKTPNFNPRTFDEIGQNLTSTKIKHKIIKTQREPIQLYELKNYGVYSKSLE